MEAKKKSATKKAVAPTKFSAAKKDTVIKVLVDAPHRAGTFAAAHWQKIERGGVAVEEYLGQYPEPLSPTEISNLRERFTVNTEKAKQFEKADYYASARPPGSGRLAEMLEESAMYSEHLQRMSSYVMLGVLPPSKDEFTVEWRVTNTDEAAFNARALRGDFYPSEGGQTRFEELSYRGVHLVEAFVIRDRDDALVAQSEPFRVLIE